VGYDAASNEDPREEGFGFNKIAEYVDMVRPDVVMIYNDPLIICKFIEAMKYEKTTASFKPVALCGSGLSRDCAAAGRPHEQER
jgi:uncharacterized protein (DUF169 family)